MCNFNYFKFIGSCFWPNIWSILENILCVHLKETCVFLQLGKMLSRGVLVSSWFIVFFSKFMYIIIFYVVAVSIIQSEILTPSIIMQSFFFLSILSIFWFVYFGALLLAPSGFNTSAFIISFWKITLLIISKCLPLSLLNVFGFKVYLIWYHYSHSSFLNSCYLHNMYMYFHSFTFKSFISREFDCWNIFWQLL